MYDEIGLFLEVTYSVFLAYWQTHEQLIDYLLIDYLIHLVFQQERSLKECLDNIETNDAYSILRKCLNREWNMNTASKIMKGSVFQKLSYKDTLVQQTEEGIETFYARLLQGSIGRL